MSYYEEADVSEKIRGQIDEYSTFIEPLFDGFPEDKKDIIRRQIVKIIARWEEDIRPTKSNLYP